MDTTYLKETLRLPTSGALAVERFVLEGETYLAIPQLAEDLPQTEPTITSCFPIVSLTTPLLSYVPRAIALTRSRFQG